MPINAGLLKKFMDLVENLETGDMAHILNCEHGIVKTTASTDDVLKELQIDGCTLTQFFKNMLQNSTKHPPTVYFSLSLLQRLVNSQTLKLSPASITTLQSAIPNILTTHSSTLSLSSLNNLRSSVAYKLSAVLPPSILPRDKDFLVVLVLEAFLSTTTSSRYSSVDVIPGESDHLTRSKFYPGMFLRCSSAFTRRMVGSIKPGCLDVVIVKTAVPAELEAYEGDTFSFYSSTSTSLQDRYVSAAIEILSDQLGKHPVAVFASQKVVHARVRSFFQQKGIIVLERVSGTHVEKLCLVCSTDVSPSITQWNVGKIEKIENVKVEDKHYLHFTPASESHVGVIKLCALSPTNLLALEEGVKCTIQMCISLLASSTQLIPGGLCSFVLLIHHFIKDSSQKDVLYSSLFRTTLHYLNLKRPRSTYELLSNASHHLWYRDLETDELVANECTCKLYRVHDSSSCYLISDLAHGPSFQQRHLDTRLTETKEEQLLIPYDEVFCVFQKTLQMIDIIFQSELPFILQNKL